MKCMLFSLVYIALNVRDGIESEYPSIVFLSLHLYKYECHEYDSTMVVYG